jgi:hypothetical protein
VRRGDTRDRAAVRASRAQPTPPAQARPAHSSHRDDDRSASAEDKLDTARVVDDGAQQADAQGRPHHLRRTNAPSHSQTSSYPRGNEEYTALAGASAVACGGIATGSRRRTGVSLRRSHRRALASVEVRAHELDAGVPALDFRRATRLLVIASGEAALNHARMFLARALCGVLRVVCGDADGRSGGVALRAAPAKH